MLKRRLGALLNSIIGKIMNQVKDDRKKIGNVDADRRKPENKPLESYVKYEAKYGQMP